MLLLGLGHKRAVGMVMAGFEWQENGLPRGLQATPVISHTHTPYIRTTGGPPNLSGLLYGIGTLWERRAVFGVMRGQRFMFYAAL